VALAFDLGCFQTQFTRACRLRSTQASCALDYMQEVRGSRLAQARSATASPPPAWPLADLRGGLHLCVESRRERREVARRNSARWPTVITRSDTSIRNDSREARPQTSRQTPSERRGSRHTGTVSTKAPQPRSSTRPPPRRRGPVAPNRPLLLARLAVQRAHLAARLAVSIRAQPHPAEPSTAGRGTLREASTSVLGAGRAHAVTSRS